VASNYTGNPTATQAPASAPSAGTAPILSLIQDADGNTAANLYQAWKVCADYIAFLMTRGTYSLFGTGADGNVSPGAGTTTLARGFAYQNLTLAGTTLKPSRFPIFVRDTLTIDATSVIQDNGNAGQNGSGATPGNGGAALAAAVLGGSGVGGNAVATLAAGGAGGNATNSLGGAGGKGGDTGGVGGTGGTVAAPAAAAGLIYQMETFLDGHLRGGGSLTMLTGGAGGGGAQGSTTGGPKGGGGGGGGGGVVLVCARKIVCAGGGPHISSIGGAGGAAEPTGGLTQGGGGGGGGGLILVMASEITGLVTSVAGGAAGASAAGFPGAVGSAGNAIIFQV
jgi:hypothetical protein